MAKRVKIPGRLESAETGNIVTGADAVMDDEKGKTQVVINSEVDAAIISLAQGKQDNLTFDSAPTEGSPNPVTSAGVYTADKVLSDAIEAILLLIPSAASALNKLVDMQTMNSSIATATASFKGTYNLVSDLHLGVDATHEQIGAALDALSLGADNNDYAFVQVPNSATAPTEIRVTERYKFNGTNWLFEYDLNNSGFTQGQWNAINSGVTSLLVSKLSDLPTNAELTALLAGKQDNLTFDNVPTAGSPNPVKSGGVYARNNEIVALINALDVAKQDVLTFDNAPVEGSPNPVKSGGVYTAISAVQAAIVALDAAKQNVLTFDSAPTLGSPNPVTSSGIKTELNRIDGNITTLNDLYEALTQSALVIVQPTDTWPVASPATSTIYRVVDRTNTPPQNYSDYMWNGSAMVLMATYDNAIDDEPTAGSNNLVKSGGVRKCLSYFGAIISASGKIVFDYEQKTLTIPQGFSSVGGTLNGTTLDLSSFSVACRIYAPRYPQYPASSPSDRPYAVDWNSGIPNSEDICIGLVYFPRVIIFGYPFNSDYYTISPTSPFNPPFSKFGYFSNRKGYKFIFDSINYTLRSQPLGWIYGDNWLQSNEEFETIDLSYSDLQYHAGYLIYNRTTHIWSFVNWDAVSGLNNDEYIFGYVYDNEIYLNGVNQESIFRTVSPGSYCIKPAYLLAVDHNKSIVFEHDDEYLYLTLNSGYNIQYLDGFINTGDLTVSSLQIPKTGTPAFNIYYNSNNNSIEYKVFNASTTKDLNNYDSKIYYLGYIWGNDTIYLNGVNPVSIRKKDKTIYFFGDSITAGTGLSENQSPYHQYIARYLNLKCLNYGIGSTGFCVETSDNVCVGNGVEGRGSWRVEQGNNTILKTIQANNTFDVVSIAAGTNDFGAGIELDVFEQAVSDCLDYCLTITTNVIICTPIHRRGTEVNSRGYTLKQYCDRIIKVAESKGVYYQDCYDNFGLNPNNDVNNTVFYSDGLHLNQAGHRRFANGYYQKINEMIKTY